MIQKKIMDEVLDNTKNTYLTSTDSMKDIVKEISIVESLDSLFKLQVSFVKAIVFGHPFEVEDCYFCIEHNFMEEDEPCLTCLYRLRRGGFNCTESKSVYAHIVQALYEVDNLLDFIKVQPCMNLSDEELKTIAKETCENNNRIIEAFDQAFTKLEASYQKCESVEDFMTAKSVYVTELSGLIPSFPNMCIYRMIGMIMNLNCEKCNKADMWLCNQPEDSISVALAYYTIVQNFIHILKFYHIKGSLTENLPPPWIQQLMGIL